MRIRSSESRITLADEALLFGDQEEAREDVLLPSGDTRLSGYARAAFDPDDPVSRTARSLRMSISSATNADSPIRSVAVINIDAPFEGSVLAANLAIIYAQGGVATVVVDANATDPRQHELLGIGTGEGLTSVLGGDVDARSVIEATPVRDLFVLPVGPTDQHSPILLDGERFHRRVVPLLDSFGMMVVDVGSVAEDPPAFCETIDAAVLIVRRNQTMIAAIQHLVGRLSDMKIIIVGTLIVD